MTNLHNAPKTLFEIIDDVLLEFKDSNLQSDIARNKIADEICDRYYTDIEPPNMDESDEFLKEGNELREENIGK
jgi:hypothetical protein